MQKVIIFLFCIIVLSQFATAANAASSPSPEAATSAATVEETTQKLKERIEKVVQERREQIKGVIQGIATRKRGFIGQVQRVSAEAITLKTNKGLEIIPLDDSVELSKKNKPVVVSDIAVESWVIVMGTVEEDAFKPLRIVVADSSLRPKPTAITVGTINSIDKNKITISPRLAPTQIVEFVLSKTVKIQDSDGNALTTKDLSTDLQALVVGYESEGQKTAAIIHLFVAAKSPAVNDKKTP